MTDAELLRQVQRGDLAAWDSLYARCLPTVWRYASAVSRDMSAAEEVVSETLLAFVQSVPSIDADTVQLHGWLRGVVMHKAADQGRQASRHRQLLAAARNGAAAGSSLPDEAASLEAEETRQDVLAALERLPEVQRLVLEWKHADEQSVREIAGRLGQTEKSVESLLYRARIEFRRHYELGRAAEARANLIQNAQAPTLEKSL